MAPAQPRPDFEHPNGARPTPLEATQGRRLVLTVVRYRPLLGPNQTRIAGSLLYPYRIRLARPIALYLGVQRILRLVSGPIGWRTACLDDVRQAGEPRTPDAEPMSRYNAATLAADMNRPNMFAPPLPPAQPPPRALSGWRARLASDPIPRLLREGTPSVLARVRRDLIDDSEAPNADEIAGYPEVKALLRKVEKDGSFAPKAAEKELGGAKFAKCLATLRGLDRLADLGLRIEPTSKVAPELRRIADSILTSQESDGGIGDLTLGDSPKGRGKIVALHFHGWAISALCRAGLESDERVDKGFRFLLSLRQDDGGWAWRGVRTDSAARPSSHLVTGMVLRAFASSKERRGSREARRAAELLATRFLQPDRYDDRKAPSYWEMLSEPRFFTDVLDALDTITGIGLGKENSGVRTAEAYLRSRQSKDGLWYPGPPVKGDSALLRTPAKPATKTKDTRDVGEAIGLTLRVLVVLRKIN
jgi:hypothetical protein